MLAEPMAVTITALRRGDLAAGDAVLIVGPGPVGLLAALAARAAAASEVVVAGRSDGARLDTARRLGFATTTAAAAGTLLRGLTGGRGADLVLEATGTEAGVDAAFDGVRRRGRIAAVGLSGRPSINVRWDFATTRDADLSFAMSSSYEAWEPALTILARVAADAATLPTYLRPGRLARRIQRGRGAQRGQGGHRPDRPAGEADMSRIVITDCDQPSIEIERSVFSAAGHEVVLAQCRTADEVIAVGQGAVALLAQYAPITDGGHGRRCPSVRVVGRYGVSLDNIELPAAAARGIRVVNVPDYCIDEVADHAIGLVLALTRGIVALDRAIHAGTWDFRHGGELRRASGHAAGHRRAGAHRCRRPRAGRWPCGFQVVGQRSGGRRCSTACRRWSLDELLATSDIVSLHAPLDPSTRHLLDAAALARMKPGGIPREHLPRRSGRSGRARRGAPVGSSRRRRARRPGAGADRARRPAADAAERRPDAPRGVLQPRVPGGDEEPRGGAEGIVGPPDRGAQPRPDRSTRATPGSGGRRPPRSGRRSRSR